MSAESALYSLLSADAAIAAVVGTRIRPEGGAQGQVSPYITYQRIDTTPVGRPFSGPAPFNDVLIQVDCWSEESVSASSPKDVFDLADLVEAALDDKGGIFNGVEISAITFEGRRSLPEPPWQRVSLDFRLWQKG